MKYSIMDKGDPEYARRINRGLILDQVRRIEEGVSRSEISRHTKLSKMTVSTIVSALINEGLVIENGYRRTVSGGGRRPVLLKLNGYAKYIAGIDIGKTNTTIGIANIKGKIISKLRVPTCPDTTVENVVSQLFGLLQDIMKEVELSEDQLVGIGVSLPGVIKADKGIVRLSPGLGWKDVQFRQLLENSTGHKVVINNCTRLMMLAEKRYGSVKKNRNVFFLNIGYGIGSAFLLNGSVYEHNSEFGHINATRERILCHCGNYGCLETVASGYAIEAAAERKFGRKDHGRLTAEKVAQMANEGNTHAIEIFKRAGTYLGKAISIVANVLNPERIVLGGGVSLAGDLLLQPTVVEYRKHVMPVVRDETSISISSLGMDSGVLGAIALGLDSIIFDTVTFNHLV